MPEYPSPALSLKHIVRTRNRNDHATIINSSQLLSQRKQLHGTINNLNLSSIKSSNVVNNEHFKECTSQVGSKNEILVINQYKYVHVQQHILTQKKKKTEEHGEKIHNIVR